MREALAQCEIAGPKSNIEFLERLVRHPAVVNGTIDTGYLDRHLDEFMAGEEFTITASIGIARAPEHGDRPQTLIQNADVAMYDSKRRARNGCQNFSEELAEQQQQRLQMETHLRRAVDNREFKLVYQPQIELVTGRTVGAEALIRWRNDTLGEMRPDHFIGHAAVPRAISEKEKRIIGCPTCGTCAPV